ncbi:MAG TPA: type II CAAX endopeptidase family protein [Mycobacteriales bacterium]|jgi:membrane protease YdiL (CAAX protease family)|nr:type II CAAX endopeptidase family protein [Mycobacteriales bacterium]
MNHGGFDSAVMPPGGRIVPAPAPPPVATLPPPANGMLDRRAVLLVAVAIGIGAVGMGLSYLLGRDTHLEPETAIRYAIVITLGVYAIVGGLLVTQLTPGIKLTWRVGNPWLGGALGLGAGGGLGLLMLLAISGLSGHLSSDPRVVTIMSEGDAAHVAVAILLTCICAPLVEEVLFRGLLLESLRTRGAAFGIWMSGIAFAIWHLNPSALRYYALMGALFGLLYVKRGLVCSMAAHAGFNGVLTIAAVFIVLAPMKTFSGLGVDVRAPGGWSQDHTSAAGLSLHGPSGAWLGVMTVETPVQPDLQQVTARLTSETLASAVPSQEFSVDRNTVRKVDEPIGHGVELDVTVQGHSGHMLFFPRTGQSVEVVFLSGGSLKAEHDFARMLASLSLSG